MKYDKILTFIVAAIIIIYLLIINFPNIEEAFMGTRQVLDETKKIMKYSTVVNYMESKPDYYFEYEGAVYCIPIKTLIDEGLVVESEEYGINDILEATYMNGSYSFNINNECIEK